MVLQEDMSDSAPQRQSTGSGSVDDTAVDDTAAAKPSDVELEALTAGESPKPEATQNSSCAEKEPLRNNKEEKAGESSDEESAIGSKSEAVGTATITKRKPCDVRCMVTGILTLVLIVGGAVAGILAHRYTGGPKKMFQFASYYGDKMVLQRAPSRAVVWGFGPNSRENITVKLILHSDDVTKEHKALIKNTNGGPIWKVVLDPVTSKGPFTITATLEGDSGQIIELREVLFGDVWICAGDANMQMSVAQLPDAEKQLLNIEDFSDIRLFSAYPQKSTFPMYDTRKTQLGWSVPSRESLLGTDIPKSQLGSHFSALCWMYGKALQKKLQYPVGLVTLTYNDSSLEDWASPDVLNDCELKTPSTSSMLWNSMIHPFLSFSVFGVLWYQGEKDALDLSRNYKCSFEGLISEWRDRTFASTFAAVDLNIPFGFVQLAPYREETHLTYGFTDVRWQQTSNYGFVPNPRLKKVFMASAIDLPDPNSTLGRMYSTRKQELADRLLTGALGVAYRRRNITYNGPLPVKYKADTADHVFVLYFENQKISVENYEGFGFEICCSENRSSLCPSSYVKTTYAPGREWVPARIVPIASSPETELGLDWNKCGSKHAVGLRYAWRETPNCSVYGLHSNLPMPPFIRTKLIDDGKMHKFSLDPVRLI